MPKAEDFDVSPFSGLPAEPPARPMILGVVTDPSQGDVVSRATQDLSPTIRISLTGASVGDQISLKVDGHAAASTPVTAADLTRGYVDVTTTELVEGVHLVSALVIGADGATVASALPMPIRVDLTAPAIHLEGLSVDQSGLSADDGLVFQFSLAVSADDAAGPGPGHNIYSGFGADLHVQLFANGVLVGGAEVREGGPDGPLYIRADDLAAGDYVFTLSVTDAAGNTGTAGEVVVLSLAETSYTTGMPEAELASAQVQVFSQFDWNPGWAVGL